MKCIDCKFCAYINEDDQEITVRSKGLDNIYYGMPGAWCMKTSCCILDVEECSAYEKSERKKAKPLRKVVGSAIDPAKLISIENKVDKALDDL